MKKRIFTLLILACILSACEMIEYHPYDGRIKGEKNINAKNITRIEAGCKGKETIRFIFMSDSQRWYDETADFVKDANKRNDIDFVIHGGDISDFGLTKEFVWMRDIMNGLNTPYVVLLGNHDCLANGEQIYREIFGQENFSFLAGTTKFICLNTNALEFDYSKPVPDLNFIEDQQNDDREEYKKTVFAMHVRPFSDQFNNNIARHFQDDIKKSKELQFCINGHDHTLKIDDLFNDGVMYFGCPNIGKRQYFIFTLNADDTYTYETIDF